MPTNEIDWSAFGEAPAILERTRVEAGDPWMTAAVAGLQYHRWHGPDGVDGYVVPAVGDRVQLVREPRNRHDRNAVRVEWRNQHMLGHVPRHLAADLAPRMDRGEALRGYIWDAGDGSAWSLKVLLVGRAVEQHHDQRLRAAIKMEIRTAKIAVWGEAPEEWRQSHLDHWSIRRDLERCPPTGRQQAAADAWQARERLAMDRRRANAMAAFGDLPLVCQSAL